MLLVWMIGIDRILNFNVLLRASFVLLMKLALSETLKCNISCLYQSSIPIMSNQFSTGSLNIILYKFYQREHKLEREQSRASNKLRRERVKHLIGSIPG